MSIQKNDIEELKRMATNCYDNDKRFLNRVIQGIAALENEIRKLRIENANLKQAKEE